MLRNHAEPEYAQRDSWDQNRVRIVQNFRQAYPAAAEIAQVTTE